MASGTKSSSGTWPTRGKAGSPCTSKFDLCRSCVRNCCSRRATAPRRFAAVVVPGAAKRPHAAGPARQTRPVRARCSSGVKCTSSVPWCNLSGLDGTLAGRISPNAASVATALRRRQGQGIPSRSPGSFRSAFLPGTLRHNSCVSKGDNAELHSARCRFFYIRAVGCSVLRQTGLAMWGAVS